MFLIFFPLPIRGNHANGSLDFAEKCFLIIGVGWPTKQSKLLRNGWILALGNSATFFWKVEALWRFGGETEEERDINWGQCIQETQRFKS